MERKREMEREKQRQREVRRNREIKLVEESKPLSGPIYLNKIITNYFALHHAFRHPGLIP